MINGMHGSRNSYQGVGSKPDGKNTALKTLLVCFFCVFFSPQIILQFTEGVQWFYYKENYIYFSKKLEGVQHFQGDGGPTFYRGGGGSK